MKGRLNGREIQIVANPSPFEQVEAHLVETVFYDEWAPLGESLVSKPLGTFVPWWEDIEDNPEPDLRKLLERKRKRKEAPIAELDSLSRCVKLKAHDSRKISLQQKCAMVTKRFITICPYFDTKGI